MCTAVAFSRVFASTCGRCIAAALILFVLLGATAFPSAGPEEEATHALAENKPGPRPEKADAMRRALRSLNSPLAILATEARTARTAFGPRRNRVGGLYGVSFANAFAPLITVTKTDQIIGDDGDGLADPGETIRYTIEIANALNTMDATGVVFTDTFDANTTLVANSENASPIAFDAAVGVAPGDMVTITLTGSDGDGDALTFSMVNAPTEGTLGALNQLTPTTAEVTYTNTNTAATTDAFTFNVNDGTVDSNEDATVAITISAVVNPAPVVTITDTSTLTYTEEDPALQITNDLTVSDNGDIASAMVSISAGFETSQDVLAAMASGAIGAGDISYNSGTGVLTITRLTSASDYQAVLRSVTYQNTSMNPTRASAKAGGVQAGTRTISFEVTDDGVPPPAMTSTAVSRDVDIAGVNDAPVVTTAGGTTAFTEDGGAVTVDATVTVTDVDDTNLESATISITTGFETSQDVLAVPTCTVTSCTYDSGTGVLTLTGTATVAVYETLLQSVTYDNTDQNPSKAVAIVAGDRTVEFVANDGTDDSNTGTQTVSVTATNDAPVVTTAGGTTAFTEDGGAVVIDASVTVSDVDDTNLESATVSITTGFETSQDALAVPTCTVTSCTYDSGTGVLTLTGTATVVVYQALLQSVTYDNTSDDPSKAGVSLLAGDRTVEFVVNDGDVDSNTGTQTVSVTGVNDAPVVTASGGTTAFTEDGGAVTVDGAVIVTDVDDTMLLTATVTISNGQDMGEEVLAATASGTIVAGDITYTAPTLTIAPAGGASISDFIDVLQSVTYENTSENPTTPPNRVIEFVVNDGTDDSNTGTQDVSVAVANDAPMLAGGPFMAAFVEDISGPVAVALTISASDVDDANLETATVSITTGFETSQDVLAATASGAIAAGDITYTAATGVLSIAPTGGAPVADFEAVLQSVTYDNDSDTPSKTGAVFVAGDRTVEIVVNDGDVDSNTETSTVSVTATNDAPVLADAEASALAYTEGDGGVEITATITAADADDTNLESALIQITGNYANGEDVLADNGGVPVGITIGAFNAANGSLALSGTASVSDYQTALRAITYENTSNNPSMSTRTISFTVNDGSVDSNTETRDIDVTSVNDVPMADDETFDDLPVNVLLEVAGSQADPPSVHVSSTTGVLDGDTDADGPSALTVSEVTGAATDTSAPFNVTTSNGGTVVMQSDGTFTYISAVGFTGGSDSFTYKAFDGTDESAAATVTINFTGEVWFIDSTPSAAPKAGVLAGNGQSNDPFSDIASFNIANTGAVGQPGAGDTIYLHAGAYTTGITLLDNQILNGEGNALTVGALSLSAGTDPTISMLMGNGVNLASGNTIRGLTVTNTPEGHAFSGSAVGSPTISNVEVSGTGGILEVTTSGDLTGVSFDAQTATSTFAASGDAAIALTGVTGTYSGGNPTISNSDGAGIAISNSAGTFTFTGASISAPGGAGIDLSGSNGTVTFTTVTLNGGGAEGVKIASNPNAVNINGGTIGAMTPPTGDAVNISGGVGNVTIAAAITNTAANAVDVQGKMGGTATFSGAIDEDGAGIFLDANSSATITFSGGLDIATNGSTGFMATNGGTVNVSATAGTEAISATNAKALELNGITAGITFDTVSSSNSGTQGIDIANVTGTVTMNGGSITGATGTAFDVGDTADMSGGDADITYAGSITNSAGRAVLIQQRTGGTVELSGTINETGDGIRLANNTDGDNTITFSGATKTINTGPNTAVRLDNNEAAGNEALINFTGGGLDIDVTTGIGFHADGGGTVNVTGSGNTIGVSGTGQAVVMNGVTIGANDITFVTINSTGTGGSAPTSDVLSFISVSNAGTFFGGVVDINDTGGAADGIAISGGSADFDFTSATIANVGGDGINISGGGTGSITFDTVDIDTPADDGIEIDGYTGSGVDTITISGGTIDDPGDAGLIISNNTSQGGVNTSGLTIDDTGGAGVAINGVNATINLLTTTIGVAGGAGTTTGNALDVNGGGGALTVGGSIVNTTARAVEVTNRTGGAVNITASINEDGTGINLDTNGAGSVNFSGGMTLDTGSNTAFNATGGGTVNVTGTNTIGASGALTGQAVNIVSTNIGANDVTFQRIDVNGAATAINLNATGAAGGFIVTGIDGPCGNTVMALDCDGGTIQNTTADAIILNDTDDFSLSFVEIKTIGNMAGGNDTLTGHDAIDATDVDGFSLTNVSINTISDSAIKGTRVSNLSVLNSDFQDANRYHLAGIADGTGSSEAMFFLRDLGGTNTVDNSAFEDAAEHLDIENNTGFDLTLLTVQRSSFGATWKNTGAARLGKIGIDVITKGSADATVHIGDPAEASAALGNTFLDARIASVRIAHFDGSATGQIDAIVSRNTFGVSHTVPAIFDFACTGDQPQGGVMLRGFGNSSARLNGIVSHNSFDHLQNADGRFGSLSLLFDGPSGGVSQVRANNNAFIFPYGAAIEVAEDGATGTVLLDSNTITGGPVSVPACFAGFPSPAQAISVFDQGTGGTLNAVVENMTIPTHDTGFDPGAGLRFRRNNAGTHCVALSNVSAAEGFQFLRAAGTHNFEQGASAVTTPFATVVANNSNTGTVSVTGTIGVVGPMNTEVCPRPSGGIFAAMPPVNMGKNDVVLPQDGGQYVPEQGGSLIGQRMDQPGRTSGLTALSPQPPAPIAANRSRLDDRQGQMDSDAAPAAFTEDLDGSAFAQTPLESVTLVALDADFLDAVDPGIQPPPTESPLLQRVTGAALAKMPLAASRGAPLALRGVAEPPPVAGMMRVIAATSGTELPPDQTEAPVGVGLPALQLLEQPVAMMPLDALAAMNAAAVPTTNASLEPDRQALIAEASPPEAAPKRAAPRRQARARPVERTARPPAEPVLLASSENDVAVVAGLLAAAEETYALPTLADIKAAFPASGFVSPSLPACTAGTCTWNIGDLPAGRSVTITFDVTVNNPFPVGILEVSNQGTLTADGINPIDSDDPDTAVLGGDPTITPVDNPAKVVINEIDYDQPGTDTAEFIELKNTGTVDVDLSDLDLVLVNGSGGGATIYDTITLPSTTLAVGGYFVICADVATVANCDLEAITSIQNGAPDAVALVAPAGTTTNVHDVVSYEGDTGAPYTETSGTGLEDPAASSPTDDNKGVSRIDTGGADGVDTDVNNIDLSTRCITPGMANILDSATCINGTINIVKVATPADDTVFDFTETITPGTFTLQAPSDDTETFSAIAAGSYDVTETLPSGWTLESIVCTGDTDGGSVVDLANGKVTIDLDAGEAITCTFTNQGRGTITIVKDAVPADDTVFDFTETITPGTFTLQDPSDDTETFASVAAGSYDVTETLPTGWMLSMIVCTGDTDGGSVVDQPNGTVAIDLDPGEDITCTFTNDGRGGITIVKEATPEDDTAFDFSETITPGTFTLQDPSDNTEVFAGVDPGSYDVTETLPTGWTLESIVCAGDTDGGSTIDLANGKVTIDLDASETITCTFSNDGPPDYNAAKTDVLFTDNNGDGIVNPGDVLEYTIEITNTGGTGTNTVFTDTPDANTTLVAGSVTTSQGAVTTGNGGADTTVEVDLGDVGSGGSPDATITFQVTVNDPFPAGVTSVSNQGSLSADNDPNAPVLTDDPNTAPGGDATSTPIGGASMLEATKADALQVDNDGDGQADPGDTIRYAIVLTNNGTGGAANVVFTDTPDANTALVVGSVTTTAGAIDNGNGGGDTSVRVTVPMLAGGSAQVTITFDVTVNTPFPAGVSLVSNQGGVTADNDAGTVTNDPDTPAPNDPTVTVIDVSADLSLAKTISSGTSDFGSEITFELVLTNAGPSAAAAVVTDLLPDGLTYVGDDGGGDYNPVTGAWQAGSLAVGATATLHITARIDTLVPVINAAEVTFASLPDPDSTPGDSTGDDYDAVTITPVAADLDLEKKVIAFTSDRHGSGPGDDTVTATFRVTVTNHGPSTATGVVVSDPVPDGATVDAVVPSQGAYDLTTESWTVGTLPVGGTATLTVTLTAGADNNLYNLAEVSADQPDQNLANNLAGAHGQHDPDDLSRFTADLSLEKTVDIATPSLGDLIVYTLAVLNSGPSTTDGVVVKDSLPTGLVYVSARTTSSAGSCPTCGYNDSLGVWIVGHLPKDSTATLEITVRVTGTGEITNTAEVLESHLPDFDSILGDGDPRDDDQDSAVIVVSTGKATSAIREGAEGLEGAPVRYELEGNYPNPFNPETVIPFGLPEARHVTVEVYNLLGQRVALLLDEPLAAGRHEVTWRATDQPSGLYLVRMRAGTMQKVQRITLMK